MTGREKYRKSPGTAEMILRFLLSGEDVEDTLGDFEEIYNSVMQQSGKTSAFLWYWKQLFAYIPGYLFFSFIRNVSMLKNYVKIAVRNIIRHKGYSLINISGLATGMACCIMIFLWVQDEISTNRFHRNIDNIFWLTIEEGTGDDQLSIYCSPPATGPVLENDYPEIVESVRIANYQPSFLTNYNNRKFTELIRFADLSIFTVFSFPIIHGQAEIKNNDPNVILISERIAKKYFDNENPVGKSIRLDSKYDVRVAGVFSETPSNSTIQFDMLMPLEFMNTFIRPEYTSSWSNYSIQTYFLVQDNISPHQLNDKMKESLTGIYTESEYRPVVYPFQDFYLELMENKTNVNTFSLIAFIILIIACINFTNLTTARSANRAREVGIRKVSGARRSQLIRQFMCESFALSSIAAVAAIVIAAAIIPLFNSVTGKLISTDRILSLEILAGFVIITTITTLLSGSYPALILSSFMPVKVLKGSLRSGSGNSKFRKILVITQFSLAIILILMTSTIFQQIKYMKSKDLGFNSDQVLYLRLNGDLVRKHELLKDEILKHPNIISAALSSGRPSYFESMWSGWKWEQMPADYDYAIPYIRMDVDFDKVYEMKLTHGKFFDQQSSNRDVIINEKFAELMGVENPVGHYIRNDDAPFKDQFRIAGVVADFHYRPLSETINPLIIFNEFENIDINYISMKIKPDNIASTISHVEKVWETQNPEFPFEYHFLDEDFELFFTEIKRQDKIFKIFTTVAFLISVLGLFGLTAYITEQRKKEIGIRKVLGSSVSGIIATLSGEFMTCIAAANIVAWPVAYYFMKMWLQDYVYRIEIGAFIFVATGISTFIIAGIIISYQTVTAARANPVIALKHE